MNLLNKIQNQKTPEERAMIEAAKAATPARLRRRFEEARPYLVYSAEAGNVVVSVVGVNREQRDALLAIGGEIDRNCNGVRFSANRIPDIDAALYAA